MNVIQPWHSNTSPILSIVITHRSWSVTQISYLDVQRSGWYPAIFHSPPQSSSQWTSFSGYFLSHWLHHALSWGRGKYISVLYSGFYVSAISSVLRHSQQSNTIVSGDLTLTAPLVWIWRTQDCCAPHVHVVYEPVIHVMWECNVGSAEKNIGQVMHFYIIFPLFVNSSLLCKHGHPGV